MNRITSKIPDDSQFGTLPRLHSDDKVMINSEDVIIPAGTVVINADDTAPTGFLECNGAAVSRTTFSRLYDVLGSRYGSGNGTTTFNLPDLRGEFIRGWDNGRGIDSGRAFGSSQTDEFKTHSHSVQDATGSGSTQGSWHYGDLGNGNSSGVTNMVDSTGGSETRPRNIAMMYCIKF